MWQRFTERARRVILSAQEEAGKMNSAHVGTEHLLLGLARENEGVAAQVLAANGVDFIRVRLEVDKLVPPNVETVKGEPILAPKSKRVLELSADEARRMRCNYIGVEHLLLALMRETKGLAATVLNTLGFELEATRAQIADYVGAEIVTPPPQAPVQARPENFDFECFDVVGEAMKLARASRQGVRSEHLWLALMTHRSEMLAQTLDLKETDWDAARTRLDLRLSGSMPQTEEDGDLE